MLHLSTFQKRSNFALLFNSSLKHSVNRCFGIFDFFMWKI